MQLSQALNLMQSSRSGAARLRQCVIPAVSFHDCYAVSRPGQLCPGSRGSLPCCRLPAPQARSANLAGFGPHLHPGQALPLFRPLSCTPSPPSRQRPHLASAQLAASPNACHSPPCACHAMVAAGARAACTEAAGPASHATVRPTASHAGTATAQAQLERCRDHCAC